MARAVEHRLVRHFFHTTQTPACSVEDESTNSLRGKKHLESPLFALFDADAEGREKLAMARRNAAQGCSPRSIDMDILLRNKVCTRANISVEGPSPVAQDSSKALCSTWRSTRAMQWTAGGGMDEDVLHRACEPFFTTKVHARGSGFGLPMVAGFVAQHDVLIKTFGMMGAPLSKGRMLSAR